MSKKNARFMKTIRHIRVRRNVSGTSERPRLSVFRSLSHIYAQIIDDAVGNTLVAASSLESEVASKGNGGSKQEVSRLVGALIGQRAKDKGVKRVIMDRGGCKYHGRIKALADAARKEGLDF